MTRQRDGETTNFHRRIQHGMWLLVAILIPGGIIVVALLAILRFAGRRALTGSDETRRAA